MPFTLPRDKIKGLSQIRVGNSRAESNRQAVVE